MLHFEYQDLLRDRAGSCVSFASRSNGLSRTPNRSSNGQGAPLEVRYILLVVCADCGKAPCSADAVLAGNTTLFSCSILLINRLADAGALSQRSQHTCRMRIVYRRKSLRPLTTKVLRPIFVRRILAYILSRRVLCFLPSSLCMCSGNIRSGVPILCPWSGYDLPIYS